MTQCASRRLKNMARGPIQGNLSAKADQKNRDMQILGKAVGSSRSTSNSVEVGTSLGDKRGYSAPISPTR